MAKVAGALAGIAQQPPVDDHATADPRPDDDAEQAPCVASRAKPMLGDRGSVGVDLESTRLPEPRLERLLQREVAERGQIRVADHCTAVRVEEPGDRYADAGDAMRLEHRLQPRDDLIDQRCRVPARGGLDLAARENGAVLVVDP